MTAFSVDLTDEAELHATRDGVSSDPPNRCPSCGRFLPKRQDGSYARHVMYDGYNGGYEWTCNG